MAIYLGIDVGTVSIKIAVIGDKASRLIIRKASRAAELFMPLKAKI